MIRKTLKGIATTGLILSIAVPAMVSATNGLFVIGYGNKSRAMGGVGIAHRLDSLSGAANPATIATMANRFDIGMDLFKPVVHAQLGSVGADSEASVNGLGVENLFFMPAIGITHRWNSKITVGFSMVAAGGGGTKFTTNFYEAANAGSPVTPTINNRLGVDLAIMEMNPTVAYRYNKKHSFGASLVIGVARFEAFGLDLFSSFTPSNTTDGLSGQGKDWGMGGGLRLGWFGNFGKYQLGAVYTSKVYMQTFNRYKELFAEGGKFDIPASLGFGASVKVMPKLKVAIDITQTFYENTPAIGNLGPNLAGDPAGPTEFGTRELGTADGLGFGWENQLVYKVGAEYNYTDNITLRGGWNYGKSPINEDREIIFNLLAPATTEHHLTLGVAYKLDAEFEINASYIHAFKNTQAGPTYISDDGSNFGRLSMFQNALGGSLTWKY